MSRTLKDANPPSAIEKVETAILDRLTENMPGHCKVEAFPADPDDYDFAGLDAAVLIHYSGSRYAGRDGPVTANQTRRMNFSCVLLVRELRGTRGAYRLLEALRQLMQGESFAGAGPAEIVSDALVSEARGQWRWDITFGLNTPAIALDRQKPVPLMQPRVNAA